MVHKILVAIDASPISRLVFNEALTLARSSHAQLGLLYVFALDELESLPYPRLETLESYPGLLDDPLQCYIGHLESEHLNAMDNPEFNLVQTYTREAIAQGIPATCYLCVGAPGVAICDFATAWNADLIVVGHRGRSGLAELLLGSVSNHVVHHASCSVHVVRQPPTVSAGTVERAEAVASP